MRTWQLITLVILAISLYINLEKNALAQQSQIRQLDNTEQTNYEKLLNTMMPNEIAGQKLRQKRTKKRGDARTKIAYDFHYNRLEIRVIEFYTEDDALAVLAEQKRGLKTKHDEPTWIENDDNYYSGLIYQLEPLRIIAILPKYRKMNTVQKKNMAQIAVEEIKKHRAKIALLQ